MEDLTAAQQQTEARLGDLAAAQPRTEARLAELVEGLRTLADVQRRTETQLGTLLSWQEGESGRRKGELLERQIVRGAVTLFVGGDGGTTEQPHVQRRLTKMLVPYLQRGTVEIPAEADPTLADVLWWKGDTVAVVEVSAVVDEHDVERAHQRAETLGSAGATAIATVIGGSWANGEVRYLAKQVYRMAYKVGHEVSDADIALRRLPVPSLPGSPPDA